MEKHFSTIIIIFSIINILFPLVVIGIMNGRGRKDWAGKIFISILLGLGWFSAILALLAKPNYRVQNQLGKLDPIFEVDNKSDVNSPPHKGKQPLATSPFNKFLCKYFGHAWSKWTLSKNRCQEHRNCKRCGKQESHSVDHNWSDWALAPRKCEETRTCKHCATVAARAVNHTFGEWKPIPNQCAVKRTCQKCSAFEQSEKHNWEKHQWKHDLQHNTCVHSVQCAQCGASKDLGANSERRFRIDPQTHEAQEVCFNCGLVFSAESPRREYKGIYYYNCPRCGGRGSIRAGIGGDDYDMSCEEEVDGETWISEKTRASERKNA